MITKWVKVLNQPPKEGTMVEVTANKQNLFITLNDGHLYCAQNRCPHEDIKLTLGCLKGNRVKCSLHGFSFDLATGKSSDPSVENLQVHPVKQDKHKIYIQL